VIGDRAGDRGVEIDHASGESNRRAAGQVRGRGRLVDGARRSAARRARRLRSMLERVEHRGRGCDTETCRVCGLVPLAPRLKRATRIVAESPAMRDLLRRVARFAASDAPVVITGETGSGKEIVARALHANSPRAAGPFVAVNVAAIPGELLESELFGHGKGAFTSAASARTGLFEAAGGGTLFLDEIGEMSAGLQVKLLRAVQDGEIRRVGENHAFAVDVRIVCATHRDLRARVADGSFREDLYYRLGVLGLHVPALRERAADILPLAARFLADAGGRAVRFTRDAEARLVAHAWPGNVRELENAVRHGAALAEGPCVDGRDLPEHLGGERAPPATATASLPPIPRAPVHPVLRPLADVEREHVLAVVEACGGSQAEAARVLGIGRNTLWRKLRELRS
jgi:two-component system response regulator HydG